MIKAVYCKAFGGAEVLTRRTLTDLMEDGALQPLHVQSFALEDAAEAMALSQDGHVRGTLVLEI